MEQGDLPVRELLCLPEPVDMGEYHLEEWVRGECVRLLYLHFHDLNWDISVLADVSHAAFRKSLLRQPGAFGG